MMEPKNCTMADLFEKQCVYLVPKYQRQYVWNLENQWEPLWLDVTEIASVLYEDAHQRNVDSVNTKLVESHFLGAVVLKVGGITPEAAQTWKVIDGQQRITTIQLLVAATYSYLNEHGLVQPAERIKLLIQNSTTPSSSQLKITHREMSYEQFSNVMQSIFVETADQILDGPMFECYRYFQDRVREWFGDRNLNLLCAANAFIHTLISKLCLVAIYLGTEDKEYLIFETLNARGEPLTEWDKIKNFLLYKSDNTSDLDQDKIYDEYLTRFDDNWWREFVGRGAQERPRTDTFADYWLESRKQIFVGVKRVFKEFKNHIEIKNQAIETEIKLLFKDAEYYRRFTNTDYRQADFETQFHNHRIELSIGAIWPLLLYLQRMETADGVKRKYFKCLESFFVRRKICGYQARGYDQVSLDILNVLESSPNTQGEVANIICKKLMSYTERANTWPFDEEVIEKILDNWQSRSVQVILLRAIEHRMGSKLAGGYFVLESVHVEHLMPKTWTRENWPLKDPSDESERNRNNLIYTLGNLTLLNAPLNLKLQNSSWSVKRKEIKKSDNLFINKHLLENYYDNWDENTIRARGEFFAKMIVEIWPHGENYK